MARSRNDSNTSPDTVISIVAVGMKIVGDCDTDGTLRVEGSIEGTVRAGKAVVVGKDGIVDGHVVTADAVIAGRVTGTVRADSRLEVQSTARIDGEVAARRMQLEEGAELNGMLRMGENLDASNPARAVRAGSPESSEATPPSSEN